MTLEEVEFAMENRIRVFLVRGSIEIFKPLAIGGTTRKIRSRFEVERGKEKFYHEVILLDPNGRSEINAGPEQLDPADPEQFAAMMARYKEIQERKKRGESVGAELDNHGRAEV